MNDSTLFATVAVISVFSMSCAFSPAKEEVATTPPPPMSYIYPMVPLAAYGVGDMEWLVASWIGTDDQQRYEEHWMAPAAANITGMFRWISPEGKVRFMELIAIAEEDTKVVMRLKHCNPDAGLTSWEAKDKATTLRLVKVSPNEAIFLADFHDDNGQPVWLCYRRSGDALSITFESGLKGDEPGMAFHFRRQ